MKLIVFNFRFLFGVSNTNLCSDLEDRVKLESCKRLCQQFLSGVKQCQSLHFSFIVLLFTVPLAVVVSMIIFFHFKCIPQFTGRILTRTDYKVYDRKLRFQRESR